MCKTVYVIHTDHLGTPKAISDKDKNIVWQAELDTFGETKSIDSKNDFEFNLRFAGQYFDAETGYHYNCHRYYDPSIGRYLTSDPIGLMGGFNTYSYVDGRPWEGVDPWGLLRWKGTSLTMSASMGVGVISERYTLWSECVKRKKGFVVIDTEGTIYGPGSAISFTGSSIELFDGKRDIDFDSFDGDYVKMGYGIGFGLTVGNAEVQIGKAKTKTSLGNIKDIGLGAGIDMSASVITGFARVVKKSYRDCGC